jgi:Flp pilus assembly protein TadD
MPAKRPRPRQPRNESAAAGRAALPLSPVAPRLSPHAWWFALALAAITIIVYAPAGTHAFIQLDDPTYVTRNPDVARGLSWGGVAWAFTTTHGANWHPLTWLSHMTDVTIFGVVAGPHHLVNVALHVASTLLLFAVLVQMTGAAGRSAFVAALFGVHPMHVESVAWIAERKDVLSGLLFTLTLWAYLRYTRRPGPGRYLLVCLLFVLGLMAKPMLVTLPFLLLLLDVWPLGRRGRVREKLPLFVLAAGSSLMTYLAQRGGGAVMPLDALPLALRVENALVSYVAYLGKMLWPAGLVVYYPPASSFTILEVASAGALLAAITAAAIAALRRHPYVSVGWAWYLGTLVPVIGLIQVGRQSMADRYSYIPYIGLFLAIAWGVPAFAGRWRGARFVLPVVATGLILAAAVTARAQVAHWSDDSTLWTYALQHRLDLDADRARRAVQDLLAEHDRGLTSLLALLEASDAARGGRAGGAAIAPARLDRFAAHRLLGQIFGRHQQIDDAIAEFREAVRLGPDHAEAHADLGLALSTSGREDEAITAYGDALRLNPSLAEVHNNLGFALARRGRLADALPHFAEAVRLQPALVDARRNYGLALAQAGRLDDAAKEFDAVLRLAPEDTRVREALAQIRKGPRR